MTVLPPASISGVRTFLGGYISEKIAKDVEHVRQFVKVFDEARPVFRGHFGH